MAQRKGKLSSSQLPKDLTDVVDGTTVVDLYVQSILAQPDIKIDELEKLPAHQSTARKHAQFWKQNVKPDIQKCVDDTVQFSNTFLASYDALTKLIERLKKGDESAKAEFIKTVDTLKQNLSTIVISHCQEVTSKLGQFASYLSDDTRNFQSDAQEAKTKIVGDSKELQSMQSHLDAINSAIKRDSTALALGGLFTIWMIGDLKKKERERGDVEKQMAIQKNKLVALTTAEGQIERFMVSLNPVSQASTTLEQGWASLVSDFGEVVDELKDLSTTDAVAYLQPILETAKQDWSDALAQADKLKPKLSAPKVMLQ